MLLRLHGTPLGYVELETPGGTLLADALAALAWNELGDQLNAHLRADALPEVGKLTAEGVVAASQVPSRQRLRRLLQDAPPISIIIPTRNRPEVLARCLRSIVDGRYPPTRYEILVVDNVPADDTTRDLVERWPTGPRVRYLREDTPGSASARNTGIANAEAGILIFTDDDVVADVDWLAATVLPYGEDPSIDVVTGLVVPMELETQAQVWFEQYGGFTVGGLTRRNYDLGAHRPERDALFPYAAGIYGTGNNMSFRRRVLADLGGFDPALGNGTPALGGVDSEMLLRTVLRGHTLLSEPGSVVFHRHRPQYSALRRQVYSYGVGLGAYLLKTALHDPSAALDLARRVPAGLRHALSSSSTKNAKRQRDFPAELGRLELLGLAASPWAYARSRLRYGAPPATLDVRGG